MNARTLLSLGLLTIAPSLIAAQTPPEPPVPAIEPAPPAPGVARAPRVPIAPRPAIAAEPATPAPLAAPQPAVAPRPATAPAPAVPMIAPPPPKPLGQLINVQIEVTLSDSKGAPKAVMLTVADGELGQNRTGSDVLLTPTNTYKNFSFNADAKPSISGNKIRLYLSAEAQVPSLGAKEGSAANIYLRQSQTLILNDGDSVEIARATDPVSERAFVLSVKVKILR